MLLASGAMIAVFSGSIIVFLLPWPFLLLASVVMIVVFSGVIHGGVLLLHCLHFSSYVVLQLLGEIHATCVLCVVESRLSLLSVIWIAAGW